MVPLVFQTAFVLEAPGGREGAEGGRPQSARAAVTVTGVQPQTVISHGSGAWMSKIKVPADSVAGESLRPDLRMPPSHCVLTWWREISLFLL